MAHPSCHAPSSPPRIALVTHGAATRLPTLAPLLLRHGLRADAMSPAREPDAHALAAYDIVLADFAALHDPHWRGLGEALATPGAPPFILHADSDDGIDRIVGLELGADDVVDRSFSDRELLARIRSVLRRLHRTAADPASPPPGMSPDADRIAPVARESGRMARFHGWQVDFVSRALRHDDGSNAVLTRTESVMLACLAERPREVVDRDRLNDALYGTPTPDRTRTVDVGISRLRRKLDHVGDEIIRTVRSRGYLFLPDVIWTA